MSAGGAAPPRPSDEARFVREPGFLHRARMCNPQNRNYANS